MRGYHRGKYHTHVLIANLLLFILALMIGAPIFVLWSKLAETRMDCSAALRQVLASRAFASDLAEVDSGVKINVIGLSKDPIASGIHSFLELIGHSTGPLKEFGTAEARTSIVELHPLGEKVQKSPWCYTSGCVCRCSGCDGRSCSPNSSCACQRVTCQERAIVVKDDVHDLVLISLRDRAVTCQLPVEPAGLHVHVHVIASYAHRDALFGLKESKFDLMKSRSHTVYVWTGHDEVPQLNGQPASAFNRFNKYRDDKYMQSETLFICGLPLGTTAEEISQYFRVNSICADVNDIVVGEEDIKSPAERDEPLKHGTAFVKYSDAATALVR
jgi:hypothetical protein